MKNFKVTVRSENQQLYLNSILLNNSIREDKDFSSIKLKLINDKPIFEILQHITQSIRGCEGGIYALSLSSENSIRAILYDLEMYEKILWSEPDFLSDEEKSDYSIVDFTLAKPLRKDVYEKEANTDVIIKFTNFFDDSIEFESSYKISSYEWNLIINQINAECKLLEDKEIWKENKYNEFQLIVDEILDELGEEADFLDEEERWNFIHEEIKKRGLEF